MTGDAIAVDATTQGFGIRRAILIGSGLMLVVMMTEVLCCRSGLVLAIAGHCRPAKLQRHEHQQKNCQPFTHKVNSVAAIDFPVHLFYLLCCLPSNRSPLKTTSKLAPMSGSVAQS